MTTHTLALALAYTGAVLGVAMVIPQIIRTVRHPQLSGVAPLSWAFAALGCLLWLVYGIRADIMPQIPGNVLLVSGAVAIVLLVPSAVSRSRRALMLAAAAAVLVLIAYQIPPHTIGYLAFGIGLISMWPQFYETVWVNKSANAAGLSLPSWTTKIVSQACWLAYAFLVVDIPVAVSATFGVSVTFVVLTVETARRRRLEPATDLRVLEPA